MFDKDEQELSQIIDTGVEAILSGKATLEEVLAENPEKEALLRPELESALWLYTSREQIAPRPGYLTASRKRVLERIKTEAKNTGAKRAFMGFAWPQRVSIQWVAALVIMMMLFTGTGGVVSASQKAMPGDPLYSVKTASEQVALSLTFNTLNQIKLSDELSDRRLEEVAVLMKAGKYDLVAVTLKAYEAQVHRTIALLENAGGVPAHEKKVMATALQTQLAQNATNLSVMVNTSPATLTSGLTQAMNTTLLSSSLAGDVADDTFDPTWTPEATLTPIPSETPQPTSTFTPRPPATFTPTSEVNVDNTKTDPTAQPKASPTPEKVKKPSVTPRPTNDNRPTQKPDPPGDPNSKPTKSDRSTKSTGNNK